MANAAATALGSLGDQAALHAGRLVELLRVREDRRDVMFDPNDPDNTMDLDQGDIIMVRYRFIKGLLEDGALDLI